MFFALNFYCTQLRFVQLSNKAYDDDDDKQHKPDQKPLVTPNRCRTGRMDIQNIEVFFQEHGRKERDERERGERKRKGRRGDRRSQARRSEGVREDERGRKGRGGKEKQKDKESVQFSSV